jgi:hypothetical protein
VSSNVCIFISYSHKDASALAFRLRDDLARKGYVVWLDVAQLRGGSYWVEEIERQIDEANVVLLLLSAGSRESLVCQGEHLRALRRGKRVLPILVHDDVEQPVYLEAVQCRDFAAPAVYSEPLEQLVQDIESRSGATLTSKYRETRYDTVPDLPINFIARSVELEALKKALLSDRDQRDVALVAMRGMGGIGKTVLAQALCHDESVQAAFPDGIIWVRIGEAGLKEAELPRETDEIIHRCAGLPLGLAMVAAMLRNEPDWRWADILEGLRNADLQEIQIQFPDYSFPSVIAAIEMSVGRLPKEIERCYLDLAVFPKGRAIPEDALGVIWGRVGKETRLVASKFVNRSLATLDAAGRLGLHALQADYVRNEGIRRKAGVESFLDLHRRLLDTYGTHCTDGWPSGPNDGYFFEHLPWHLKTAGRNQELKQLLINFEWLRNKSRALGPNALIADYDLIAEEKELRVIQSAIQMSAHVVSRDPQQLAGQLTGRLLSSPLSAAQILLHQIANRKTRPWIRPLAPSLYPAGGSLVRTLLGHSSEVESVVVTSDTQRAVSAAADGTLRLWHLGTGKNLRTFKRKEYFSAVAVTPDGRFVASASKSKLTGAASLLRLWDLETGDQTVRRLEGHTGWVTTLSMTLDGRRIVSGSQDGTIRLWDLEAVQSAHISEGHGEPVSSPTEGAKEQAQIVIKETISNEKSWPLR